MLIYQLTIITENQNRKEKAEKLALLIVELLNANKKFEIEKYYKFDNSFKIEITGTLSDGLNHIFQTIELSDRIARPWLINYDRDYDRVELIFNKSEHSNFRDQRYNVINWALLEIVDH